MISAPERAALVAAARAAIERGSKSFVMASRLFDRRTRERSWLLYAWCRACDDAVDGQSLGWRDDTATVFPGIDELRRKTDLALAGHLTGELAFDALAVIARECALPPRLVHAHLDGFALDAVGWRPRNKQDLLLYCYHVAGTVGIMMALVMGVRPEARDTLNRACDLGIAFQLGNIARDIAEDQLAGRCYLPTEWLSELRFEEASLLEPAHRAGVQILRNRLAMLSACYERSGRHGAARLPFRCRWAVLAAAGIYGDIARQAAASNGTLQERVRTSTGRKIRSVIMSLFAAMGLAPLASSRSGLWTSPGR